MSEENAQEHTQITLDLRNTSLDTLELFMDESTDPYLFKDILLANDDREEVIKLVYSHANTPEEIRMIAAGALNLPMPSDDDLKFKKRKEADQRAKDIQEGRLIKRIAKLTVSEKVKLGMKGNSEARGILMKESNKLVVLAVLDNPRITESEVESIAKNRSVIEDALRTISKNRHWMKNYSIVHALVTNPKTPAAIAMTNVTKLKAKDLGLLEKNKNVSEAVRSMAKKLAKAKKSSSGGGGGH